MQDFYLNFLTTLSSSLFFPQPNMQIPALSSLLIMWPFHYFITLTFLLNIFESPSSLRLKMQPLWKYRCPLQGFHFWALPQITQKWEMLLCSHCNFIRSARIAKLQSTLSCNNQTMSKRFLLLLTPFTWLIYAAVFTKRTLIAKCTVAVRMP